MLADAKTHHSDIMITALSFAAWAEARGSELEREQNHLLGVTHMVQGRGGLVRLPQMTSHPTPYPFIWMGIGASAFPNARSLEDAIISFLYVTNSMQDLQRPHHQDVIRLDAKTSQAHQRRLETYIQARRQAFGSLSALCPFLQVPFFDFTNQIQMRSHVVLLWLLNKILWKLRSDPGESSSFLRELDRHVTASNPTAQCLLRAVTGPLNAAEIQNLGLTSRQPMLKAHAIIHVFANCLMMVNWPPAERSEPVSAEFREVPALRWYISSKEEDDDMTRPPVIELCETADVVELLQHLFVTSRQKVLDQLSAWFLANGQTIEPSDDTILSGARLEKTEDLIDAHHTLNLHFLLSQATIRRHFSKTLLLSFVVDIGSKKRFQRQVREPTKTGSSATQLVLNAHGLLPI